MSEEETEAALPPSKSQRKREAHALQSLGKKLTSLREKDLAKIPITDEIRSALQEYKRLPNSHEARRRQLQFIGKLMRDCDLEEIASALVSDQNSGSAEIASTPSPAAVWRDRILTEGDEAIEALVQSTALADRQKLRQLLRNIKRSPQNGRSHRIAKLHSYLDTLEIPA